MQDDRKHQAFRRPPELSGTATHKRPVVVIGAGPVGLACAIDLASRGIPVVVVDESDTVAVGSRAICWAKRTLEIFARLGVGTDIVKKGVTWNTGRVFHGDVELFNFDLLPERRSAMPAFVNLQQYHVEQLLVDRLSAFPLLADLRWLSKVTDMVPRDDGASLDIATPEGHYRLEAEWVIVAEGAKSPTRQRMNLPFEGQRFDERFLIADVRMAAPFPSERLFWFDPTFHRGESALLHRQPDEIFRIDFQLGPDADPQFESEPERVLTRVRAIVGTKTNIELVWCSVYSFRCARIERFVHGRVIFAGDSAHVVSPFGARGGNGGIQDADNLCWKLAAVLCGQAPSRLIETYDEERGRAADENILNSSRTTRFMTPKTKTERRYRDAVVSLCEETDFARSLLNGGRLSKPCRLDRLSLQTVDGAVFEGGIGPGDVCEDAPVINVDGEAGWLLEHLNGSFAIIHFAGDEGNTSALDDQAAMFSEAGVDMLVISERKPQRLRFAKGLEDREGIAAQRYGARDASTYLIRPDAHVAARFPTFDGAEISRALRRAKAMREDEIFAS